MKVRQRLLLADVQYLASSKCGGASLPCAGADDAPGQRMDTKGPRATLEPKLSHHWTNPEC